MNAPIFQDIWTGPPREWLLLVAITYPPFCALMLRTLKPNPDLRAMLWLAGAVLVSGAAYLLIGDPFAVFAAKYFLTLCFFAAQAVRVLLLGIPVFLFADSIGETWPMIKDFVRTNTKGR